MLGSFGSAALYYGFAFLMVIWMVVKIARGSGLLAVATFFIWPLALISLIKNWGDPDTDIRIPFFAGLLALVLSVVMVSRGVDRAIIETAAYYSEEDLQLIQQENPEMHALIMAERERIVAEGGSLEFPEDGDYESDYEGDYDDEDDSGVDTVSTTAQPPRSAASLPNPTPTAAAPAPATAVPAEDPLLALPAAVAGLAYQYATVNWPAAGVSIELPARFRFLPEQRLGRLATLRSQPRLPGSLGWIVHESVDLAQPDAWVLEVRFLNVGHTPLGLDEGAFVSKLGELSGVQQRGRGGRRLGEGSFAPQWDGNRRVLTWSLADDDGRFEHRAALPLRSGVLFFLVRGLNEDQRELGLRLTRLMANRVQAPPSEQWRPAALKDAPVSATSLIAWVGGEALESQ
ncbi:MAG: hypothetical protein ACT4NL_15270 [Pseudomarimonas sp.]